MTKSFNPFESRTCRDIRNELGSALIESIRENSLEKVRTLAKHVLAVQDDPEVNGYVSDRLLRYKGVMEGVEAARLSPGDIYDIAHLLWQEGLFFECHEWLEQIWSSVEGREKTILQALIRSTAAFEFIAYGRTRGAFLAGSKALKVLVRNPDHIPKQIHIRSKVEELQRVLNALSGDSFT